MSAELKSCPFCGSEASMMLNACEGWHVRYVKCSLCAAQAREFVYSEPELAAASAIEAWNLRSATEIETLRASISKIEEELRVARTAFEQIAERGTGPDFEPTDAERALYWSEVAIRCRRIASQALNTMNTRRGL